MKRNLIENIRQEFLIKCDNDKCDFKVINSNQEINTIEKKIEMESYINKKCPNCGDILLTEIDFKLFWMLIKCINWINKYFSWITFFYNPNKEGEFLIEIKKEKINIQKNEEL